MGKIVSKGLIVKKKIKIDTRPSYGGREERRGRGSLRILSYHKLVLSMLLLKNLIGLKSLSDKAPAPP